MSTITVVGSLNYDLVTYTDSVPQAGETFQANFFENHIGGKGLNEAIAVSRLLPSGKKVKVRMVGNVGDDTFGVELKKALDDSGVDLSFVKTLNGVSSGVATILVEKSGNNRILIVAGANGELKPSGQELEEIFFSCDENENHYVILQNEFPYTFQVAQWLKQNKPFINIAYNPSPFNLKSLEIFKYVDLLIVNEVEALQTAKALLTAAKFELLDKDLNTKEGLQKLATVLQNELESTNSITVIVTGGSLGAACHETNTKNSFFCEAHKVKNVVDTTGAGDTFFGGTVVSLSVGQPYMNALKFASAASSLAIQKKGAAESIPTYHDIVSWIQQ